MSLSKMNAIKKFRARCDSKKVWTLRKDFIRKHRGSIPDSKLVTLSYCYMSNVLYGCRYPKTIMSQLTNMSEDLKVTSSYIRNKVNFIKTSESSLEATSRIDKVHNSLRPISVMESSESHIDTKREADTVESNGLDTSSMSNMNSVSKEIPVDHSPVDVKYDANHIAGNSFVEDVDSISLFKKLDQISSENKERLTRLSMILLDIKTGNALTKLQHAVRQVPECKLKSLFECKTHLSNLYFVRVLINSTLLGLGNDYNKIDAKRKAYEMAVNVLTSKIFAPLNQTRCSRGAERLDDSLNVKMEIDNSLSERLYQHKSQILNSNQIEDQHDYETRNLSVNSDLPFQETNNGNYGDYINGPTVEINSDADLSQFVLTELSYNDQHVAANPISVLQHCAHMNKCQVIQTCSEINGNGYIGNIMIKGILTSTAHGGTKAEAKQNACQAALESLRKLCHTLRIKRYADANGEDSITLGIVGQHKFMPALVKIPESNIGNQMLRKMGWKGGGLGVKGNIGISEPVKAGPMTEHRTGLGSSVKGAAKKFYSHILQLLQDYSKSDFQDDLVFSSELTKNQRKTIHILCARLNLKSQSRGKDGDRYLIVSRRRTAKELLNHVMGQGGSTNKYEVVKPLT